MWTLRNAFSSGKERANVPAVTVQDIVVTGNGYSGDLNGVTWLSTRKPVFVADNTDTVTLNKQDVAILQWVARACEADYNRLALRFVLADYGRICATNGHTMHFAPVPVALAGQRRLLNPAKYKPGLVTIETLTESTVKFPNYEVVIPRHWAKTIETTVEKLAPIVTGKWLLFRFDDGKWGAANAAFYANAIKGLPDDTPVRLMFNVPAMPMGFATSDRAAVIMPLRAPQKLGIPEDAPCTEFDTAGDGWERCIIASSDDDHTEHYPKVSHYLELTAVRKPKSTVYWI